MRRGIFVLVVLVLWGCATASQQFDLFRAKNRRQLVYLSRGISKDSALAIMGVGEVRVRDGALGDVSILTNPHRTEIAAGPSDTLEIYYYYTDKKKADDAITDDELTPLVFREGVLLGWGNAFMTDIITKYEIRVR